MRNIRNSTFRYVNKFSSLIAFIGIQLDYHENRLSLFKDWPVGYKSVMVNKSLIHVLGSISVGQFFLNVFHSDSSRANKIITSSTSRGKVQRQRYTEATRLNVASGSAAIRFNYARPWLYGTTWHIGARRETKRWVLQVPFCHIIHITRILFISNAFIIKKSI